MNLPGLADPVRAIAHDAGQAILAIYEAGFTVTEKEDQSPVTEADLAAHDRIVQGLSALTPDIPILSEEDSAIDVAERLRWDWLWLVDPLDGTREFIRRNGQFCVNIALVHHHEVVFGLILIPLSGACYFAHRGGGARKRTPRQAEHIIHSRRPVDQKRIRVAGSRSAYAGRPLQTYLKFLGEHDYLTVGGALKSCLVAEGEVDLYPRFGPTYEWDTAAAQIIVEEAGGGLTDMAMRPLRYNARPTLLNPDFFVFGDPNHDWSRYLPGRDTADETTSLPPA